MSKKGKYFFKNRCAQCGRRLTSRDGFCNRCGDLSKAGVNQPLQEEVPPEAATIEFSLDVAPEVTEVAAPILAERHYIGDQYNRYMKAFSVLRERKSRISWNWSAFLGGPFWLLYRKLYLPGFLLFALCLASAALLYWLLVPVYLLGGLLAGLFGDALVRRRVCRLIEQGRTLVEPYRSQHIRKKGGVQAGLAGLFLSLFLILNVTRVIFLVMPPTLPVIADSAQTCAQAGCFEPAVDGGAYCNDHTCLADFCVQQRQTGSQYCMEHLWMNNVCAEPGCQEETVEGGMYCPNHTCMFDGCVAHRAYDSEFCAAHTPETPEVSKE